MAQGTPTHTRRDITTEQSLDHGYAKAVVTQGGTTVWLAGEAAITDSSGKPLRGDIEGQVREVFAGMDRNLKKAGGSLANLVTMTVFITDVKYGEAFWNIRKQTFTGNRPASAFIVVSALAHPDVLVEIQGVAVI